MTRTARKHKIGKSHALAAMMDAGEPTVINDQLHYIGRDDRDIELHIIAIPDDKNDGLSLIHCQPTSQRR